MARYTPVWLLVSLCLGFGAGRAMNAIPVAIAAVAPKRPATTTLTSSSSDAIVRSASAARAAAVTSATSPAAMPS